MMITTLSISALRDFTLGSVDPKKEKHGINILIKCIDFANDLEARIILINGYDEYLLESNEEARKQFLKNLENCTRYAASKGVIIGLENADKEFADSIKKATDLVREVDSPFLKVYADIGNATNAAVKYDSVVISDIASGAGEIVAVHLKTHYRESIDLQGMADFNACIDLHMKSCVGIYMAELFYREDLDWKKEMQTTHDFLRGFLEKCLN